jgi:hypothetical protein
VSTDHFGGEIEVGDVDGDGRPDVLTNAASGIRVYHAATRWTRTDHATGCSLGARWLEAADVNGDRRVDAIATACDVPASIVSVLTQNAAGGLVAAVTHPVASSPGAVEAADLDGDGRNDVVALHDATLSVLRQKPDGTLATPATFPIPYAMSRSPHALALGDVDGDRQVDVVIADWEHGLVVLRNASGPTPGGEQVWVRGISPGENASAQAPDIAPKVTFQRALALASVTASTVRLVNGKTGATVAATVAYDSATRTVTIKPTTSLPVNTPFRIVVKGVRDTSGATQAETFTSTFRSGWYRITARLPR